MYINEIINKFKVWQTRRYCESADKRAVKAMADTNRITEIARAKEVEYQAYVAKANAEARLAKVEGEIKAGGSDNTKVMLHKTYKSLKGMWRSLEKWART